MKPLRALVLLLVLVVPVAGAAEPLTPRERNLRDAADALRLGIPAAAFALTFVLDPRPRDEADTAWYQMGGSPRHDLVLGLARTALVTEALKRSIDARRPNGDMRSFPSGHASIAFSGAEFIRHEYGWAWGAPAYLAAGFVAWSRVETHYHYTRDVLAGAAIGVLANHDLREWRTRGGTMRLAAAPLQNGRFAVPGLVFELRQ